MSIMKCLYMINIFQSITFFLSFFKISQDQFILNFEREREYDNNQRFIEYDKDDNNNRDRHEDNRDLSKNLSRDKNT